MQSVERTDEWKLEVRRAFGVRLREVRHAAGLSQEELALHCGLDRSYVGQIERGERNLSLENIHKLAGALGIEPGEFFRSAGTSNEGLHL